jgi:hypothetical protein
MESNRKEITMQATLKKCLNCGTVFSYNNCEKIDCPKCEDKKATYTFIQIVHIERHTADIFTCFYAFSETMEVYKIQYKDLASRIWKNLSAGKE